MPTRRSKVAIGFMIVWLVFWGAGILIVLYGLARAIGSGSFAGMAMMTVWLAAAVFGLVAGIRKLRSLVLPSEAQERSRPAPAWRDAEEPRPSTAPGDSRPDRVRPLDPPPPPVT